MLTARDIMQTATPTLEFSTSVAEAIETFRKNKYHFAAVIASEERYHGVLTEGGLVRIHLKHRAQPKKDALIHYREIFEPCQLIQETEIFPEVVKKIMTAVGNRVFVIDSGSRVKGFITAKDVLPLLSEGSEKSVASQELQSDMYLYESFFAKSPFMMHSVNQDGIIRMANEMLHRVLGYAYGELIGKTIRDLYPPENHQQATDGIKQIFDSGYHRFIQTQMVHKNGHLIPVELVSRVLKNSQSSAIGTVTVSRPQDMKYLLDCLPEL